MRRGVALTTGADVLSVLVSPPEIIHVWQCIATCYISKDNSRGRSASAQGSLREVASHRDRQSGSGPVGGDRGGGAGHSDAVVAGGQVDEQAAGVSHVRALQDRDARRDVDQSQGA